MAHMAAEVSADQPVDGTRPDEPSRAERLAGMGAEFIGGDG